MHCLSQKVSYASMIIDTVISGISPNEEKHYLHNCDIWIINFGKRSLFLGFSNTYHVDSLDRFRKVVIENVINIIETLNKRDNNCLCLSHRPSYHLIFP